MRAPVAFAGLRADAALLHDDALLLQFVEQEGGFGRQFALAPVLDETLVARVSQASGEAAVEQRCAPGQALGFGEPGQRGQFLARVFVIGVNVVLDAPTAPETRFARARRLVIAEDGRRPRAVLWPACRDALRGQGPAGSFAGR
jgi:hypothetical protein